MAVLLLLIYATISVAIFEILRIVLRTKSRTTCFESNTILGDMR